MSTFDRGVFANGELTFLQHLQSLPVVKTAISRSWKGSSDSEPGQSIVQGLRN